MRLGGAQGKVKTVKRGAEFLRFTAAAKYFPDRLRMGPKFAFCIAKSTAKARSPKLPLSRNSLQTDFGSAKTRGTRQQEPRSISDAAIGAVPSRRSKHYNPSGYRCDNDDQENDAQGIIDETLLQPRPNAEAVCQLLDHEDRKLARIVEDPL
jgi:hypothetical protein